MSTAFASWQLWALLSRRLRGADRDLREGRCRRGQFGSRDLHPDRRYPGGSRRHPDRGRPGQPARSISGRTYLFLALSGLATGASWLCYFRALQIGDAARVAPVDKLSVVLVAIFATAFLGEELSALNWAGIALVALGAILVAAR